MVGQGAGDHRLSGRVLDCNALAADHGFIYRAACERVSVKSALMRSRGRRTTRSPRTSWLASMTLNWPSRRTRALIAKRVPPRSGHPLLLPSVLTVALPSGLAAWLAWRRSTWAPVAVIDIAAPAEEIFDVIVDARNEPRWNPKNAPSADAHSRACRRGYDVSGGVRSGGGRGVDRGHEDRPSPLMDGDKPVTSP
jgi:hypothetical protein